MMCDNRCCLGQLMLVEKDDLRFILLCYASAVIKYECFIE